MTQDFLHHQNQLISQPSKHFKTHCPVCKSPLSFWILSESNKTINGATLTSNKSEWCGPLLQPSLCIGWFSKSKFSIWQRNPRSTIWRSHMLNVLNCNHLYIQCTTTLIQVYYSALSNSVCNYSWVIIGKGWACVLYSRRSMIWRCTWGSFAPMFHVISVISDIYCEHH